MQAFNLLYTLHINLYVKYYLETLLHTLLLLQSIVDAYFCRLLAKYYLHCLSISLPHQLRRGEGPKRSNYAGHVRQARQLSRQSF